MTIRLTEHVGLLDFGKTVSLGALSAHLLFAEAKLSDDADDSEDEDEAEEDNKYRDHPIRSDNEGWYFFGTIQVGTPAKNFDVVFDTGSSHLFLRSTPCAYTHAVQPCTVWDPRLSTTATVFSLKPKFSTLYGTGSAKGSNFTDTVTVAGLTATDQTIGAAATYSNEFAHPEYPSDGLLGMGFQTGSVRPLIQTLHAQGKIQEPVFFFKLATSGGDLSIAKPEPALYKEPFAYASVLPGTTRWVVNLDSIKVDGRVIPGFGHTPCHVDTGTAIIHIWLDMVDALYKGIDCQKLDYDAGTRYYYFPNGNLPTVTLTFGGVEFEIPPSVLGFNAKLGEDMYENVSGIAGRTRVLMSKYCIIGATFLRTVYTAFDLGVKGKRDARVGFAALA